jgi:SAM-dependent methyltransferase
MATASATEPSWVCGTEKMAKCPGCGSTGSKPVLLRFRPSGLEHEQVLCRCPDCGCAFFSPPPAADYNASPPGGQAALAFYLQQGAGLWSITSTIAALQLPRGQRMLEIGCGYGFGLDFARRALDWNAEGFDPSPFAAAGRHDLGVPITLDYYRFGACQQEERDVILCSEVLEHMDSPIDFLRQLRQALRPGGALVLTTPNADAIRPDTPPGLLIPLLSVGYHTVLQSARSLRAALETVGFANIKVEERGASLLAHATDDLSVRPTIEPRDRARYRAWLLALSDAAAPGSDLRLGGLARAFREAVNAQDLGEAQQLFEALDAEYRQRLGRSLDEWNTACAPTEPDLEALAKYGGFALGPVLFHRALHRLLSGEERGAMQGAFERAGITASIARQALRAIGVDDGDLEDISWVASSEAVLCAAWRGAAETTEMLRRLELSPGIGDSSARRDVVARRVFTTLVNQGHYSIARVLRDVARAPLSRAEDSSDALADDELDALFSAAVLEANTLAGDAAFGVRLARGLRSAALRSLAGRSGGSAATLVWPTVEVEMLLLEKLKRTDELVALRNQGIASIATHAGVPPRPRV